MVVCDQGQLSYQHFGMDFCNALNIFQFQMQFPVAFQDGGLLTNNPCSLAIHESKRLWPNTPLQTVISIGNGVYHGRSGPNSASFTTLREKLLKVVASATDVEGKYTIIAKSVGILVLPMHLQILPSALSRQGSAGILQRKIAACIS